jgi:cephalosporin hydroxylase
MITKIKSLFNPAVDFKDPVVNADCSEFEINNWVVSEFVVKKLVPVVGYHPFPLNELMLMASAVCRFRPKYIFEWGTHIGKSARIFYETSLAFGIDCMIHSIDLPDDVGHTEHPHEQRGMLVKDLKNVTLHQGDGLNKAIEIYKSIGDHVTVLFFVDGDHSYDSVRRELSAILSEVRNPAVLLHDTFYQSEKSKYNIGPYCAINDVLKKEKEIFKQLSTATGLPGMTLIYK